MTDFPEHEVRAQLFTLMKFALVESSMHKINGANEMTFSMAFHGVLFLGLWQVPICLNRKAEQGNWV